MIYLDKNLNTFGRYKDIGIRVRNDATNGDVIKAMFPDMRVRDEINYNSDFIEISLDGVVGWALSKQWWNAPYKR